MSHFCLVFVLHAFLTLISSIKTLCLSIILYKTYLLNAVSEKMFLFLRLVNKHISFTMRIKLLSAIVSFLLISFSMSRSEERRVGKEC